MKFKTFYLIGLFVVGLFLSCDGGQGGNSVEDEYVTINKLKVCIENVDPSFWNNWNNPPIPKLFVDFWVYYSGNVDKTDFQQVRVEFKNPEKNNEWYGWNLYVSGDGYDRFGLSSVDGDYIGEYERFWSNEFSSSKDAIFCGATWRVWFKLKNGTIITKEFATQLKDETTDTNAHIIKMEDFTGSTGLYNAYYALKKATVVSIKKITSNSTFEVKFSINDSVARNCSLNFYDSNGVYIGYYNLYKIDSNYHYINVSALNAGSGINNNGNENTALIPYSSITLSSGKTIDDISKGIVVLNNETNATQNCWYVSRSVKTNIIIE